jgi:serine/threonine protein kinase
MSSGFIENTDLHYIAVEKLGPSLRDLLLKRPGEVFTLKTTIQIGIQVLERLESLHSAGYVHKNLKPKNIMLMSDYLWSDKSSTLCLNSFGRTQTYLNEYCGRIK